jgi:hypothetical protein
MGKAKKQKAPDSSNWVPGWFGSTLMVRPNSDQFQKHLRARISKAALAKPEDAKIFEKVETERRFGM